MSGPRPPVRRGTAAAFEQVDRQDDALTLAHMNENALKLGMEMSLAESSVATQAGQEELNVTASSQAPPDGLGWSPREHLSEQTANSDLSFRSDITLASAPAIIGGR